MTDKALTPKQAHYKEVRNLLAQYRGNIGNSLPKHIRADYMMRVVLGAVASNFGLQECTPESIVMATLDASQLGLAPDGALGLGHLVPFKNRSTGRKEATFIPGYKGLVELAFRTDGLSGFHDAAVYAKDTFSFGYGLKPHLEHTPYHNPENPKDPPGDLMRVYAVAWLKGVERPVFRVLELWEVEEHRAKSPSGNRPSSAWMTDYDKMARKTAIIELCRLLPKSPELQKAADLSLAEEGVPPASLGQSLVEVQPVEFEEVQGESLDPPPPPSAKPTSPPPPEIPLEQEIPAPASPPTREESLEADRRLAEEEK